MTQKCNNRWIFDEIKLINSPSKRDNIGHNEELIFRQKGTNLIKEMAESLKLKPICMNTAIVYFHRFFMIRSFKRFDVNQIAICSLFLAAKFEEQPIFKENIIKVSLICRNKHIVHNEKELEIQYKRESDKLINYENEMLLTLGFDLSVIHPHTVIINASQNNSVINKNICQKAYLIASDLLRLTTLCLQFRPTFIACVCVYLSSQFLKIPITTNTNNWWHLIDPEAKLEDVVKVAKSYKNLLSITTKPSTDVTTVQKKRTFSFDNCSPESAYSSGSGNSPIYDTLSKQNERYISKGVVQSSKRIRSEQTSTVTNNCVNKSSINAINNYQSKQQNSRVLPNDSNGIQNSNSKTIRPHNYHTSSNNPSLHRKVTTGKCDELRAHPVINSTKAGNIAKNIDHIISSSTDSAKILNVNKFNKESNVEELNHNFLERQN